MAKDTAITWDSLRKTINQMAIADGEWAGYPLPVEDLRLRMEDRFPIPGLNGMTASDEPEGERVNLRLINLWYSEKRNCIITIYEIDGRRQFAALPEYGGSKLDMWIKTLGASDAWDIDAEGRALEKLHGLVGERKYKQYVLTGSFIETSKRSGVVYMFRKLRPTIAIRECNDRLRILAVLCMHPQGYYEESWAGVMVPTDDVIAALLYMRGDEKRFWAKANPHPLWTVEAGL